MTILLRGILSFKFLICYEGTEIFLCILCHYILCNFYVKSLIHLSALLKCVCLYRVLAHYTANELKLIFHNRLGPDVKDISKPASLPTYQHTYTAYSIGGL